MTKLRIALLGCGSIMNKHAGQSKHLPEVEVVGLCDIVPEQMRKLADKSLSHLSAVPPMFETPAQMYDATHPDAVIIATPHTLHYAEAVEALDRGLHVLVEKPMVTDLAHAQDLAGRVPASGKIFCIAYNTPCSVELFTLRHHIRNKTFGELKVVNAFLSQPWYYGTKGKWRQDPALSGGGMLYDSAAHMFNSIIWAVENDIAEVQAWVNNLDCPVDINGVVNIRFANGVLASAAVSGQAEASAHASFMFEQGRIDLDPWNASWMNVFRNGKGREKYPQVHGKDGQPLSNFVDAILGRDEPRTHVKHGLYQSQLMDAIYASARSGQVARPGKP